MAERETEGADLTYNGYRVGSIQQTARGVVFHWQQTPLYFKSTDAETAFAMSDGFLGKLQRNSVTHVVINDHTLPLSRIEQGEVLAPDDDQFDNPPSESQRVVYV